MSITNRNFTFTPCEADGINKTACAVLTDITLDVAKIADFVKPIVAEFVNTGKTGVLDKIVAPLEPLRAPIPGLSEITGKGVPTLVK